MNNLSNEWRKAYEELSRRAELARDAMYIPFTFLEMYDELTLSQKDEAKQILKYWLTSDMGKLRWLGRFIIQQRKIVSLNDDIEMAIIVLKSFPQTPQIKDEIEDLKNVMTELSSVIKSIET